MVRPICLIGLAIIRRINSAERTSITQIDLIRYVAAPVAITAHSRSNIRDFPFSSVEILVDLATWKSVGLLECEVQCKPTMRTLLCDVNAIELTSGPFNMEITEEPAEHLTVRCGGNNRILRVLSIDQAFELYRVRVIGATRYLTPKLKPSG